MELQQPLHHQYDSYFVREIIDFYNSLLSTDKTDHIFVYFHKVITTAMKKKKKKNSPTICVLMTIWQKNYLLRWEQDASS